MTDKISDYRKNTELLNKDSLLDKSPHHSETMHILISMQDAYQFRNFPKNR